MPLVRFGEVVSYSCSTSNHNLVVLRSVYAPVVSYSCSTSNHNSFCSRHYCSVLYLILVLHQTTTLACALARLSCCILFLFYIKPQPQLRTSNAVTGCILFLFYIKPQHSIDWHKTNERCILFLFYIKPQRSGMSVKYGKGCILFLFYIKPQHAEIGIRTMSVVSYSCSTSNHNLGMLCV